MTKTIKQKNKKEKKISFKEGLKIVESIKKKVDQMHKTTASSLHSHEYSL